MRTLLIISAAALLAGSMAAYGADVQSSEAAMGYVGAPTFAPAARAQVLPAAPHVTAPAPAPMTEPIIEYRATPGGAWDTQNPTLSR